LERALYAFGASTRTSANNIEIGKRSLHKALRNNRSVVSACLPKCPEEPFAQTMRVALGKSTSVITQNRPSMIT
jgi:hypothetical protein